MRKREVSANCTKRVGEAITQIKTKRKILSALTEEINAPRSYCTGYKFISTRKFDPYIATEKKYNVKVILIW